MKKFKQNDKYTHVALYVFITAGALMILWQLIVSSANLWESFASSVRFIWHSISTIVAGLILGYILSPAVELFEKLLRRIFKKKKDTKKKKRRIHSAAIAIVYLILVFLIALSIAYLIPQLIDNIVQFSESLPDYIKHFVKWYDENLKESKIITSEYTQDIVNSAQTTFVEQINQIALNVVTGFANSVVSIVTYLFNFAIALVISFYYLFTAKDVSKGISEFSTLRFGKEKTISARSFLRSVDWVFGKYISAKLIEVLIIFIISQITFWILNVNLSTLMAVFVAITNIVPYIGPVIGMIPPIIISLLDSSEKALWVFISLFIMQQIDGNIIQPNLIGDKMGLSPFWVIVVVIAGGNLFGLPGIILSVPVAAVIRILIKQYVKSQRAKQEMGDGIKS